jgi:anion-transporting  ArsA/GET3 family ATPase
MKTQWYAGRVLLDDLLSRRLVVLSGKGGVGKSAVGTALALAAHDRGQRVLFVEVDAPSPAAQIFGAKPGADGIAEVLPGLYTVNLVPRQVMDEYVRETARIDLIARKILANPVYHRFFAAAPGLPELMVLGKLMVLEEERIGWPRRPRFDVIVLDAPATGHALSFLKVPLAASNAVPVGPVGHNARRILAMLRDPARTALVVVAIPEEMAVVEAIELSASARKELGIATRALVLNACHERRFTAAQEMEVLELAAREPPGRLAPGVPAAAALALARHHIRRRKLSAFYLKRLQKAVDAPVVTLPFLFEERLGRASLQVLAERLEAA